MHGVGAVGNSVNAETGEAKASGKQVSDVWFIVYDQNFYVFHTFNITVLSERLLRVFWESEVSFL